MILDPFCGCGTAIEAAEKLGRRWVGIDITYFAIHVIERRLERSFGPEIKKRYKLLGRPESTEDAVALAARDWLEFQKWAVITLGGLPKDQPGADAGIDGIVRYHRVGIEQPKRAVVSVKGGLNVGVDAVHKLKSVVDREKAELGILVCINPPTDAMRKEALSLGLVGPESKRVPRLQIVTVEQLFREQPIKLPGTLDPPEVGRMSPPKVQKRGRKRIEGQSEMLFDLERKQRISEAPETSRPNRSIRKIDVEVMRPATGKRGQK